MIIAEIKGKQYSIEEGKSVTIDFVDDEAGKAFDDIKVLYYSDDKGNTRIGTPYLEDIKVSAEVKEQFRDRKVMVMHYKKRSGIRRKQGHRQKYTILHIRSIQHGKALAEKVSSDG